MPIYTFVCRKEGCKEKYEVNISFGVFDKIQKIRKRDGSWDFGELSVFLSQCKCPVFERNKTTCPHELVIKMKLSAVIPDIEPYVSPHLSGKPLLLKSRKHKKAMMKKYDVAEAV